MEALGLKCGAEDCDFSTPGFGPELYPTMVAQLQVHAATKHKVNTSTAVPPYSSAAMLSSVNIANASTVLAQDLARSCSASSARGRSPSRSRDQYLAFPCPDCREHSFATEAELYSHRTLVCGFRNQGEAEPVSTEKNAERERKRSRSSSGEELRRGEEEMKKHKESSMKDFIDNGDVERSKLKKFLDKGHNFGADKGTMKAIASEETVQEHDNLDGPNCPKCDQICKNNTNLKNHILSHYYHDFYRVTPDTKPYPCPTCGKENRDRITLIRHLAFSHGMIFELTDVTPEMLNSTSKRRGPVNPEESHDGSRGDDENKSVGGAQKDLQAGEGNGNPGLSGGRGQVEEAGSSGTGGREQTNRAVTLKEAAADTSSSSQSGQVRAGGGVIVSVPNSNIESSVVNFGSVGGGSGGRTTRVGPRSAEASSRVSGKKRRSTSLASTSKRSRTEVWIVGEGASGGDGEDRDLEQRGLSRAETSSQEVGGNFDQETPSVASEGPRRPGSPTPVSRTQRPKIFQHLSPSMASSHQAASPSIGDQNSNSQDGVTKQVMLPKKGKDQNITYRAQIKTLSDKVVVKAAARLGMAPDQVVVIKDGCIVEPTALAGIYTDAKLDARLRLGSSQ